MPNAGRTTSLVSSYDCGRFGKNDNRMAFTIDICILKIVLMNQRVVVKGSKHSHFANSVVPEYRVSVVIFLKSFNYSLTSVKVLIGTISLRSERIS